MTDRPFLECRDITVQFGGVRALDAVTITAQAGSITGLIGPNGAGKSTMLAVASGVLSPKSGSLLLDGEDVTHLRSHQLGRLGVARTFQAPQLVGEMTVLEHIVLAQRIGSGGPHLLRDYLTPGRSWIRADELERASRLLSGLDIGEIAAATPGALPMGTRRLVEVAQALATRPKVLLLDEPAAGLNEAESAGLADLVQRVCERFGVAVLLVEHDLELVLGISSNIFVIDFGRLIDQGPPEHIRQSRQVKEAYLGVGV
ncbi:ABC transporter ATP-binding protein [Rhodococcus olei]|uniref:ABC transporter ATP-binding protein n=1 Tax=Rhodococcus olei TaxID=2161675 RepID=A0ABP8NZE7_9NOCA